MGNEICYWDEKEGVQKTRDATDAELAEIEARKNRPPPAPPVEKVDALIDFLVSKKIATPEEAETLKGK